MKGKKTGGRKSGTANKATTTVREAIAKLADGSAGKFLSWIEAVAEGDGDKRPPDPEAAAKLYLSAIEYHIPKLARSEVTGKDGGPIVVAADSLDQRA